MILRSLPFAFAIALLAAVLLSTRPGTLKPGDELTASVEGPTTVPRDRPLRFGVGLLLKRPADAAARYLLGAEVPGGLRLDAEVQFVADGTPVGEPIHTRAAADC